MTTDKTKTLSSSTCVAPFRSQFGLYWRPGTGANAKRFLIHFQGGGFCTALDEPSLGTTSCAGRAVNDLGSSLKWPPTACGDMQPPGGFGVSYGGVLSDSATANPHVSAA